MKLNLLNSVFVSAICLTMTPVAVIADGHGIGWSGDLRYRHEMISKDGSVDRHRQRIRGRIAATKKINDSWTADVRLVSGSTGAGSATSTNATLDNAFSTQTIGLDRFSATWKNDNNKIVIGKMSNPLYRANKSTLIWDGDVSPEGIAYGYWRDMGGTKLFFNAAGFWLNEQSAAADTGLAVAQVGAKMMGVTAGASYYGFANMKGQPAVSGGTGSNSVDTNGNYTNEYKILEVFAEWAGKVAGMGLTVGGSVISNGDASSDKAGHQIGFSIKKGPFKFKYYNLKLEKDATLDALTESDAFGGGTDGEANVVGLGYNVAKNFDLGLAYYAGKTTLTTKKKNDRAHFDLKYKF